MMVFCIACTDADSCFGVATCEDFLSGFFHINYDFAHVFSFFSVNSTKWLLNYLIGSCHLMREWLGAK